MSMSILTSQEFDSTYFLSYIIFFLSPAVLIPCKSFL